MSTYLDLLIFRKPGQKVAQFAGRAEGEIRAIAEALPALERAGKTLPFTAAPFGGPREREYARWLFPYSSRVLQTASHDAQQFAAGSTINSFDTILSNAQSGRARVNEAIKYYGSEVSSNARAFMEDASNSARYGVNHLESVRYTSDVHLKRNAASAAAFPLYDAGGDMTRASDDVLRMIGPWRRYDELKVGAEDAAERAVARASTAAKVKGVGPETHSRAANALKSARDAETAVLNLEPRQPIADTQKALSTALSDLTGAKESAKSEPTPRLFYAKALGAWAGTLGVGAGAGFGIYKLATSGDDS